MVVLWRSAATAGDGQFHITFLVVGSADTVLIQTPEGRNLLINGGASTSELSDELGRRLPFFSRKLDWLIIASTQEEQLSALPRVIERYPPEHVLWSGNVQASFSARLLDEYFAAEGIPLTRAEAGQMLDLGGGAFIEYRPQVREAACFSSIWKFSRPASNRYERRHVRVPRIWKCDGAVDVLLLSDSGMRPPIHPTFLRI